MKNLFKFLLLGIFVSTSLFAQRAFIQVEGISPEKLITQGFTTNSVSNGLKVFPNQTFIYLAPFGVDTVLTATFTFVSRPTGSAAAFTTYASGKKAYFKADVAGKYDVKMAITFPFGTKDTTYSFYAGTFLGAGNYDGVVSGAGFNCWSCHQSNTTKFVPIWDKWKTSKHATMFKRGITGTVAPIYGTSCFKCHTTGSDHNIAAVNGGFDDVATTANWVFYAPPGATKWDSLKAKSLPLTQLATIGCESCHGPGSNHNAANGSIDISYNSGVCAQCHDQNPNYTTYAQWENSKHSMGFWSNSFAQAAASQNNSLQNCIRCHNGKGYINYTKGRTTNTTGWVKGQHDAISCQTCHDSHSSELRKSPAVGDTLSTGFNYSAFGGKSKLCMDCHKTRRLATAIVTTGNATNPHSNGQTDVLLGRNAAEFGSAYPSTAHMHAIPDLCVTCHVKAPNAEIGTVNRNKVGGHTMKLRNPETNFQVTATCTNCHGPKATFDDFRAFMDYDGDGIIESVQGEVKGLITALKKSLPPVGLDSIITTQLVTLAQRKAYWNYYLIFYDGSYGLHNPKFIISALLQSINAVGGNMYIPVELTAFNAASANGMVTLKWETASETNNSGFNIERGIDGNWTNIGFVKGKGTTTEMNNYSFVDDINKLNYDGVVNYRLKQVDYDGKYSYSKELSVNSVQGPTSFSLSQNHPNPFNPTTIINFVVPKQDNVKIVIYDAMGREVNQLMNDVLPAGKHQIIWNGVDGNGAKVASGIYFYRLESSSTTLTKKMILMK